jgi:hypothetical protein
MNLPIRFPSVVEVITEEVARFRALSDEDRVRTLGELFHTYHFLASHSATPEALVRIARDDEGRSRAAIEEFVKRHG